MNKNWKLTFLSIYLSLIGISLNAQILDNSLFRIYRAEFVSGAVTQLRLDSDSSYQIRVIEIHCSLCDHEELTKTINSNGKWEQKNDTIYIEGGKKLLIEEDSMIRPLFVLGINIDSLKKEERGKITQHFIETKVNVFHLVYDTYPNGIVKMIIDRYRMRKNEYEIEFKLDGSIKTLRYFWDGKRKKRIK